MFTGIVEELGTVAAIEHGTDSAVLRIDGPLVVSDATHGASIAVNGVCLTVTEHDATGFTVDVMAETLARSSLGALAPGDRVNLERAMPADGRFGGHVVQGHVDGVGTIASERAEGFSRVLEIVPDAHLLRYVVEKGSICVAGVSLTVAALTGDGFEVCLIPHTCEVTSLGSLAPGSTVNLEVDILAKYVERLLTHGVGQEIAATIALPDASVGSS
jgi:riboflavin synthase